MKYVGGITRKITKAIADSSRNKFSSLIKKQPFNWHEKFSFFNTKNDIEIELVSFSSSRDIEEQVLSILSFIKHAGIPMCWTIYSDGSHTDTDKKLLESLGSFISLKKWDESSKSIDSPLAHHLTAYATEAALGKRLISYISHKINKKTIFLDSDILFYSGIKSDLKEIIESDKNWFTPEVSWGTVDSRYGQEKSIYQVNAGFSILSPGFKWENAIEFIASLNNTYEYFSEQTSVHIAITSQNSYPLDPRKYILHTDDQFIFGTTQNNKSIAMRHFVSPVRHKMWQSGHKWHLGL